MEFCTYIVAKQKIKPVAIEIKSTSFEDHMTSALLSFAMKIN